MNMHPLQIFLRTLECRFLRWGQMGRSSVQLGPGTCPESVTRRTFGYAYTPAAYLERETHMNRKKTTMLRHRHLAMLGMFALFILGAGSSITAGESPARDGASYTLGQVSDVNRLAGIIVISGVEYQIASDAAVEGPGEGGLEHATQWHRIQPGTYVTYAERDGRIESIRLENPERLDLPPGPPPMLAP